MSSDGAMGRSGMDARSDAERSRASRSTAALAGAAGRAAAGRTEASAPDGAGNSATGAGASLDRALRMARRHLGPDVTVQRLLILLAVHRNEGLSQRELLALLESTSVTALSRNLADLSERTSRKTPGPGLLELRVDPMNLRRKTVHLTDSGRTVVDDILAAAGREG